MPPLLLAQTVNIVVGKLCRHTHIVPLLDSKVRPVGKSGRMAHETMSPGPVSVAFSSKSLLAVLL